MSEQHYDIIGDVHGHADALRRLLLKLGYTELQDVFRHDTRKVIFVGDFVDRGPDQKGVLRIARNMCEAGTASSILGNHEFNAIAWATPNDKGGFLREHSEKNKRQHAEFLRQLNEESLEYYDAIDWFKQLPVWLEFSGLRVVHACWHKPSCAALRPYLDTRGCFTEKGFREALRRGSTAYVAADILLKGPEQRLPAGMSFVDGSGDERQDVRIRWWDPLRQHSGKRLLEWMTELENCRTSSSRLIFDTWKVSRYYSGTIGWMVNRQSHSRMLLASTLA